MYAFVQEHKAAQKEERVKMLQSLLVDSDDDTKKAAKKMKKEKKSKDKNKDKEKYRVERAKEKPKSSRDRKDERRRGSRERRRDDVRKSNDLKRRGSRSRSRERSFRRWNLTNAENTFLYRIWHYLYFIEDCKACTALRHAILSTGWFRGYLLSRISCFSDW